MESIVPRSKKVNWLLIVWEPGWPHCPVQRYEIRECVPNLDVVIPELVRDLKGRSPRERGSFVPVEFSPMQLHERSRMSQSEREASDREDGITSDGKRWISDSLVSFKQWQVFQETRCYSQRFWIIQGNHGGHKHRLSQAERNYMQTIHPETPDTPSPGSLPYAEWDARVKAQMIAMDRLKQWTQEQDWSSQGMSKTEAGIWVGRRRQQEEEKYRTLLLKWLDSQIADVNESVPLRWRDAWRDKLKASPVVGGLEAGDRDDEALEQGLITNEAA